MCFERRKNERMKTKQILKSGCKFIPMLFLACSLVFTGMTSSVMAEEVDETEELFRADHKVKFDANGGEWSDDEEEEKYTSGVDLMEEDGLYFPLSDVVTRDGYYLDGWTKEKNGTERVEEPYWITEEITLYAKWVKIPVVKFDLEEGSWASASAEAAYENGILEDEDEGFYLLPTKKKVARQGYFFEGWTETKNGTEIVDYEYATEKDIKLYAKWRKQCRVTYSLEGGSWAGSKAANTYGKGIYTSEDNATVPVPVTKDVKNGSCFFLGWSAVKDGPVVMDEGTKTYTPEDNVTFYASWLQRYTFKLDVNGGKWSSSTEFEKGKIVEKDEWLALPEENAVSRKGYIFLGWTEKENAGNLLKGEYQVQKDTTLYARWAKVVQLTLDAGKGYFGKNKKNDTKKLDVAAGFAIGDVLTEAECIPQNGKLAFEGWFVDKKCTTPARKSDIIKKDTTYYAKWSRDSYKITVANLKGAAYVNRATGQYVNAAASKASSYSFYIAEGDEIGSLSANKKGKEAQFYFDKACKQKPFYAGYVPTGNTTVYAKYVKTVTVTWDADGGSTSGSAEVATKGTVSAAERVTVEQLPAVVRDGYYFVGWYAANESSRILAADAVITKNTTVKAKWEKGIKITLNLNGGSLPDYYTRELLPAFYVKAKTAISVSRGTIPAPTRSGYSFAGWKSSVTKKTVQSLDGEKPAKATVYSAVWSKKFVKVTLMGGAGSIYDSEKDTYVAKTVVNVLKGKTLSQADLKFDGSDDRSGRSDFLGWSLKKNGTVLKESYKFTKSVTLYPVWAKNTDIRVVVIANGGVINNKVQKDPYIYYVKKGSTLKLPGSTAIKRAGYKLSGWYTDYKLSKKVKNPNKFKPTKNCYVYAKWSKK